MSKVYEIDGKKYRLERHPFYDDLSDVLLLREVKERPMPELKPGMRVRAGVEELVIAEIQASAIYVWGSAADSRNLYPGLIYRREIDEIRDRDGDVIWRKGDTL